MTKARVIIITIALWAASLTACKEREVRFVPAEGGDGKAPALVLKTYEVPGGHGQQLRSVLSSVFSDIRESVGARAQLSPDGQLLVLAPAGIHDGVAQLLANMKGRKAPPPSPTIELRYWLVVGRPASSGDAVPFHGFDPTAIRPALDAIRDGQGPMEFWTFERLQVQMLADRHAQAQGMLARVFQTASLADGKVIVDVELNAGRHRLDTRLSMDPGQLVVLGETGIDMQEFKPAPVQGDGPFTLFYIVRADVVDAG